MSNSARLDFVAFGIGFLLLLSLVGSSVVNAAAPESFDNLRIKEAVNSVEIKDFSGGKVHAAKVNEMFGRQQLMTTGAGSRAELLASDGTVTRVGAHTVFSFVEGKREVNLEKGTLLFNSPSGKGGGVIRSPGATAAVMGTSIIVSATKDGGFKLLVLEGSAKATLPKGGSVSLGAGQLTFILPGNRVVGGFGPMVTFRLRDQVAGAKLVIGFKTPLASLPKINAAQEKQEKQIAEGKVEATTMQVSDSSLVDTSLAQSLRAQTAEASPLRKALESDHIMTDGRLPQDRIFDYPRSAVPKELMTLLGPSAGQILSQSAEEKYRFAVARNLSVIGDQGDSPVITNIPFVAVAKDMLTVNEGLSSDSYALQNPEGGVEYGPANDPPLWFAAGRSVQILNTALNSNNPWMLIGGDAASFGAGPSSYPEATVEIANAAVANGGGMVGIAGSRVTIRDAKLLAYTNITITGGEIEIANAAERSVSAGFRGQAYNSSNNTAPPPNSSNYSSQSPGSVSSASTKGDIVMQAKGGISVTNAALSADNVSIKSGASFKANETRMTAKSSISISAPSIDINSTTAKEFLAGYGPYDYSSYMNGTQSSGRISMDAVDRLSVKNASLGAANISLDARTVVLEDVNFRAGSNVVLTSGLGQLAANPNSSQPVEPRKVNFVKNVNYAGQPAQNEINSGGKITLRANGR